MTSERFIVVCVTAKDRAQARRMVEALLKERLIACANIIPGVQSFFWWRKKIDRAREVLIVIKTKRSAFKKIVDRVRALHSYQVPEVIALPVIGGNYDYLKWIEEEVT